MMISVLAGGTRTSTPLYPSSANSLVRNSFSSALKTPSAINLRFFDTTVTILGQLPGEELIQLSLEDSVRNKLALFRHLCRHVYFSCRSESSNISLVVLDPL